MTKQKSAAKQVTSGKRSPSLSPERRDNQDSDNHRQRKRLRKGNVQQDEPVEAKPSPKHVGASGKSSRAKPERREGEVEATGRFQYLDENEHTTSGKHSHGKGARQTSIEAYGEKSATKKQPVDSKEAAAEKARLLEEKKKAHNSKRVHKDDLLDVLEVSLKDDRSDDGLAVDDSDEERIRELERREKNRKKPKAVAKNEVETEEVKKTQPKKSSKKSEVKEEPSLKDQTIGFVGQFKCCDIGDENNMVEMLKALGCSASLRGLTKDTTMLVTGYQLSDGKSIRSSAKYKDAHDMGIKILDENEFSAWLRKATGMDLVDLLDGGADILAATTALDNHDPPVRRQKSKQSNQASDADDDYVYFDETDDRIKKFEPKKETPKKSVQRKSSAAMDIEVPRAKQSANKKKSSISPMKLEKVKPQRGDVSPSAEKKAIKSTVKRSTKKSVVDIDDNLPSNRIKGPLNHEAVVFTGLFHSCNGDNKAPLQEMIKKLDGTCPSGITRKTTLLVGGYTLPDGRETSTSNKYKDAVKNKTPIMTEDEFSDWLKTKTGMDLRRLLDGGADELAAGTAIEFNEAKHQENQHMMEEEVVVTGAKPGSNAKQQSQVARPASSSFAHRQPKMMDIESISPDKPASKNELWTEKYAPNHVSDIIGNTSVINKLRDWIKSWDDVVIHGNKKEVKFKGGFGGPNAVLDNPNARAALLSGPPGIGKTSTVRLLCKELGYNLIEQNASDMRNKNAVQGTLNTLADNTSLTARGQLARSIILMDEVDGMSSDRGGTAALNECIKKTKVPIICVCNDRSHPKMRTLAGNCYDLRFVKPVKAQAVERIRKILQAEVGNTHKEHESRRQLPAVSG